MSDILKGIDTYDALGQKAQLCKEDLIDFEKEIADLFNEGKIPYPVHFAGGNEDQLIAIFKNIKLSDWVFTTWRAHYHCLLKGVPRERLKAKILEGRSIALCFREQKILSSAIVGGIAPIALGVAWAIKERGSAQRVYCFIGDMARNAGAVWESMTYADGHNLPITWVIEDNGLSVVSNTQDVWGKGEPYSAMVEKYTFTPTWPHVGTGKWVAF